MEAITAVKAAAVVVKNKDNIGKIIGGIIALVVTPILLVIALYLQVMSAFASDGILKSSEYFDGSNSNIHRSLQAITEPYYAAMKEDMTERRNRIIDENTYEYEVKNAAGEVIGTEVVIPTVTRKINLVPENLIIGYLIMMDAIDVESGMVNESLVKDFLNVICTVEEIDQGNDNWLIENKILTVGEIADLYFSSKSDKTQFSVTCNAYGDYFDVGTVTVIVDNGDEVTQSLLSPNISNVPLYLQYDLVWGSQPYGNGTIQKKGCCPTCLAMVFSYLCQQNISPSDVVAWSGNDYYVNGQGTDWSIFAPAASNWGVSCTNIGRNEDQMLQALSEGKLIIASMGPGTFTKGGHFIVLTGITANGGIKVNDPNDNNVKKHIDREFEVSLILRECKNMWVFSK